MDDNHFHTRSISIDEHFTVDRWQAQPPSAEAGQWFITIGDDEDSFQFRIEDAAKVSDAITALLDSIREGEGAVTDEQKEYERIRSAYWALCIFLQDVNKNLAGKYDIDQVEVAKIARRALDNVGVFFEFTSQTPIEYEQGDVPSQLYGRSTPMEFDDLAHVIDRRGQLWVYSEPSDTWTMRDRPSRISLIVPTSARSYHRLMAEFGPLKPHTEG